MISPDPTLLTGPLLLGHIFNASLYSVELLQFYRYYVSFPEDRPWTRRLVYSVLILDTLQSGFAIHNAWRILGSGWGQPLEIFDPEWSWGTVPLFTGIVSLLVQGFYAFRIHKLIQSRFAKWIVAAILLVSVAQCFCGVLSGVLYALGSFTDIKHRVSPVTTVWLGGTALCDLMITTTIVTFLLIKISGFTPSDTVVSRIIKMTVEIGAVTTSAAGVDLILFLGYPNNNLHLMFCIPLAKLYSNTLLAMLNARKGSFMQDDSGPGVVLPTINIHHSRKAHSPNSSDDFTTGFGQDSVIHIRAIRESLATTPSPSVNSNFALSPCTAFSPQPIMKPQRSLDASHVRQDMPYHKSVPSISRRLESFPKSPSAIPPKRKNQSAPLSSFRNSILRLQRPTKAQANADFDKDFPPSHLDLSPEPDNTFRKWFPNRITN